MNALALLHVAIKRCWRPAALPLTPAREIERLAEARLRSDPDDPWLAARQEPVRIFVCEA
ncbi:hypothetical protein [Variovorax sp. J22R115]|uniref:hypothetical protein n=1 Tax=Variovorax sp. J22R115 TaxID=3053509 RepID=UPI002575DD3E|nr:hypothetical protein [Variovorax sp. J22R115]MDM0053529.1 hypothetical protein [Variovorax sp. J22R115]